MTDLTKPASVQAYARLAGAIYLVVIVFGGLSEGVVTSSLVVPGDTTSTMRNILSSVELWNMSALGNLIVPLIAVVQLWIEYMLFASVNKKLAQLFVLLNIASLGVEAISKLFLLMVVPMLQSANLASSFSEQQVFELAGLALMGHDLGFNIALIFFGCALLVLGYLIFKSGFLPRTIGVLIQLAGLAYLAVCLSQMFAPSIASLIIPAVFVPVLIGEASLCLWLLVKGVNIEKWNQRLTASGSA